MTNGTTESYPVTAAFRSQRLDRFLQAMLPRMSRAAIQAAIDERVQLASGAAPKPARRVTVGDVVHIRSRTAAPTNTPSPAPIAVLAEGTGWCVIDKPAGIAVTPSARRPGEDITSRLGAAPAHRLDRFTSGCLLLTHDAATARHFDLAFRARAVGKHYLAIVHGSPPQPAFDIDAPLGPAARSRVPGKVAVSAAGAAAHTHIEVLARHGARSLVRATLHTGRRHQLRAHLAHCGHPIVGDLLYGGDERQFVRFLMGQATGAPPGLLPGRHLLHAQQLSFVPPNATESIVVRAALPHDFDAHLAATAAAAAVTSP